MDLLRTGGIPAVVLWLFVHAAPSEAQPATPVPAPTGPATPAAPATPATPVSPAPPVTPPPVAAPTPAPSTDTPTAAAAASDPVTEGDFAAPEEGVRRQDKHNKSGKHGKRAKLGKVTVSGFLAAIYKFRIEQNDDGVKDADAFRLGKVVVRIKGRINEYVGYTIEIDPRSPTLPGVLRDGYLSLHVIPGHQIRIGQQKTPFGYENWISSTQLYTIYRSELSEGIGRGITHRDIGIGLVGSRKLTEELRFDDAVALVNGSGFGVQADDTQLKNLWGRVGVRYTRDDLGIVVRAGLSGAIGDQREPADPGPPPVPSERFKFKRVGADLEVDHRWVFFGAEYASSWEEAPADSGMTDSSMAYFVTVAGKTPWHAGPVVRFDVADAEDYQRITVGGYYGEPKAAFRWLLGYEYFQDDLGVHDGRITTQVTVVF